MKVPPDPDALTQPIPVVGTPPLPPPRPARPAPPSAASPGATRAPYAHRFGSVPLYLLRRFAAFAIDLLGFGFVIACFAFNAFDRGYVAFAARNEAGFLTLAAASLGAAYVFALVCEAITGTTLGKLVFALHTRRTDGTHAGGRRVFVRYLLLPLDLVAIGPLLALVTPRRQRLGDLLSGTVVAGSRLRFFAPVLGVVLAALVLLAQITYGGGLTSAIEVLAESSIVAPGVLSRASHALGLGSAYVPAVPLPSAASAQPSDAASPGAGDSAAPVY